MVPLKQALEGLVELRMPRRNKDGQIIKETGDPGTDRKGVARLYPGKRLEG